MDAATLGQAMGGAVAATRYRALVDAFNAALIAADCTTAKRAAMFCAQVGHESGGLRYMEEIASGAAYEGRKDLGNTHKGDGRRFKGRGPIQVTGRANYRDCSKWAHQRGLVPTATYFVDHPDKLASDKYGFIGAVWYWQTRNLNRYADKSDVRGATRVINGGFNGLDDRVARWNRCRKMGNKLLPTKPPKPATKAKIKKGDRVQVTRALGAPAHDRAPAGKGTATVSKVTGKRIVKPKGWTTTVLETKTAKGNTWIRGGKGGHARLWYCGRWFKVTKPTPAKPKINSPVPGFTVSTPYKKRPNGWPNRHTYWTSRGYHTGADYAAPKGAKVIAVRAGTVHRYTDPVLGKVALLYADNGQTYWYCHLSAYVGKDGRKVKAGQTIGKVGATGTGANGPHLHLERRKGHSTNWRGKDLDPLKGW